MEVQNPEQAHHLEVYDVKDLPSKEDPFVVFRVWFEEAREYPSLTRYKTMSLATSSKEGKPSLRCVEMKTFDSTGIIFMSFSSSRKGVELESNPFAAATFFWAPLDRQVRIEGKVEKVSRGLTEEIFHSRSKEIQLLRASSSPYQNSTIGSRSVLEEERSRLQEKYKDPSSVIPCPPHWAGYKIVPSSFEFYQGHSQSVGRYEFCDRFLFTKQKDDSWKVERLVA